MNNQVSETGYGEPLGINYFILLTCTDVNLKNGIIPRMWIQALIPTLSVTISRQLLKASVSLLYLS